MLWNLATIFAGCVVSVFFFFFVILYVCREQQRRLLHNKSAKALGLSLVFVRLKASRQAHPLVEFFLLLISCFFACFLHATFFLAVCRFRLALIKLLYLTVGCF